MKRITGGISKDKSKVLAWAKKENRKVLWLDEKGQWHAATDLNNTPFYSVKAENLEGVSLMKDLAVLAAHWNRPMPSKLESGE